MVLRRQGDQSVGCKVSSEEFMISGYVRVGVLA